VDGILAPIHFIRFAHSLAATRQPDSNQDEAVTGRFCHSEPSSRFAAGVGKKQMTILR